MRLQAPERYMRALRTPGLRLRQPILLLLLIAVPVTVWQIAPRARQPSALTVAAPARPTELTRIEETGRRLYLTICAFCHGEEGDGFGLNAPNLAVPPRDHTDAAYMASRTDEQLFAVIKHGGTSQGRSVLMPPWGGRFTDREITALVAYLRTLSRPPASRENTQP